MNLQINGQPRVIEGVTNVTEVVAALGLPAPAVLVEHNGTALRRSEWDEIKLQEGDTLEMMQIAAGG